jgi:hypothetical protein
MRLGWDILGGRFLCSSLNGFLFMEFLWVFRWSCRISFWHGRLFVRVRNCLSETALVRMACLLVYLRVLLRRCIARMVYISFCETNDSLSYLLRIRMLPLSGSLPEGNLNMHVCCNERKRTWSRIDEYNQGDRLILYSYPQLLQTHALPPYPNSMLTLNRQERPRHAMRTRVSRICFSSMQQQQGGVVTP